MGGVAQVISAYTAPSALRALDPARILSGHPLMLVGSELRRARCPEGHWRDFATQRGMTPEEAHAAWLSFPQEASQADIDVIEDWAAQNGWSRSDAAMPPYDPRAESDPWARLVAANGIDYVAEHIAHPSVATTGVPRLDEALGGGMVAGTYTVVGGEGGAGKTALAMNAAYRIAMGGEYRALLFSAEITRKEAYDRLLSVHTQANVAKFGRGGLVWWSEAEHESDARLGHEETMRLWHVSSRELDAAKRRYLAGDGATDHVIAAWRDMSEALGDRLVIVDEDVTCDRICETVTELTAAGVQVVPIVDHMHAIAPPEGTKGDQEYDAITAISHAFRQLAKSCRCPMLVLSELRNIRDSERKEPQLGWFRGSGHVGYDAGSAIILMRGEETAGGRTVEAHVKKNRRGESGAVLQLTFNGRAQTIE